jgi:hypothetical protein
MWKTRETYLLRAKLLPMKQYFAKYLPVEGEIQVGDYVYDISIDMVYKMSEKAKPYKLEQMNQLKNLYKKVKLFLCNRDIQVGDTVKPYTEREWVDVKVVSIKNDGVEVKGKGESGFVNKSSIFSLIGEISPNAKWVKEGDEFDENQVYQVGNFQGLIDPSEKGTIEVKCPCCETFK